MVLTLVDVGGIERYPAVAGAKCLGSDVGYQSPAAVSELVQAEVVPYLRTAGGLKSFAAVVLEASRSVVEEPIAPSSVG